MKKLITALLLAFVIISSAIAVFQVIQSLSGGGRTIQWPPGDYFVVFYFHGNKRCSMCNNIETFTRQVVAENFADKVTMRVLNWQEPVNKAYVDAYKLIGNAVILVEIRNGRQTRFKNLEKIWDTAHDSRAFKKYIHEEVSGWIH